MAFVSSANALSLNICCILQYLYFVNSINGIFSITHFIFCSRTSWVSRGRGKLVLSTLPLKLSLGHHLWEGIWMFSFFCGWATKIILLLTKKHANSTVKPQYGSEQKKNERKKRAKKEPNKVSCLNSAGNDQVQGLFLWKKNNVRSVFTGWETSPGLVYTTTFSQNSVQYRKTCCWSYTK